MGTSGRSESAEKVDVRPLSGNVGAEIFGVDLSEPLEAEIFDALHATLLQWRALFFRDQRLSADDLVRFSRLFGELTPAHPLFPPKLPEHPEIFVLDNREAADYIPDEPEVSAVQNTEGSWHTDVTFAVEPPMGSALHGVVVPSYGGDTHFTNLVTAYRHLSVPIQELLDTLRAVNNDSVFGSKARGVASVHPVVRVHPETGEKALFVNPTFTSHIVGLSALESRSLLGMLFDHMGSHQFTCRFRWERGSLALWDNRSVAHLVPRDVPAGAHRLMHRTTIVGDVPVGPDGFRSYPLACDGVST
jgi:alpha-ketoglutarate-dependent taurine dioxygenase